MDLMRIEAPYFTAGVEVDKWGIVVRTAPILAWAQGKPLLDLRRYCKRKGWKLTMVQEAE